MRETICTITCDKCGSNIKGRGEWELVLDLWAESDDTYASWKADLCAECKEAVLTAIIALGVNFRYLKE